LLHQGFQIFSEEVRILRRGTGACVKMLKTTMKNLILGETNTGDHDFY